MSLSIVYTNPLARINTDPSVIILSLLITFPPSFLSPEPTIHSYTAYPQLVTPLPKPSYPHVDRNLTRKLCTSFCLGKCAAREVFRARPIFQQVAHFHTFLSLSGGRVYLLFIDN